MAKNTIKGLTVEIGGDTTKLGKALADVDKKSRDLQGELRQIDRLLKLDPGNTELIAQKQKVLAEAVETTAEKLKTLKEAEKQVQKQFQRGEVSEEQVRALQREIVETEKKLESYKDAAKGAAKGLDDLDDSTKKAEKSSSGLGATLGSLAKGGVALVAAGVTATAGALIASAEATREYRTEMGKLDTAFTTAGHSSEAATKTYKALQGVLGETDQAVEAANHLAKLTKNEQDLEKWTNICTGVYATFGASLPIEGLTEAANETAKVGKVTGPLADALNWAGVNEDKFNESLEACSDEQERQTLIMETLNGLYTDAASKYQETNAEVIRANQANEEWMNSMAEVGGVIEPLLTDVKLLGASLLSDLVPGIKDVATAFRGMLAGEDGAAASLGEAISGIFSQLLTKITELLPGLVEMAISLIITLCTSIIEALPQLIDTVVQVLLAGIPQLIDGAVQLLLAILDAIPIIIPPLVEAIPQIVLAVINGLLAAIPALLDGAVTFLLAIVQAIPVLLRALLPQIPTIVDTIINGLLDNLPLLIDGAIQLFFGILEAIPEIQKALIESAPSIVSSIVSGLLKAIPELIKAGGQLLSGLVKGMLDFDIVGAVKGIGDSVVKGFKKVFDIRSPSRRLKKEIGKQLPPGIAEGIEESADAPIDAMAKLSDDMIDEADALNGLTLERRLSHTFTPGTTTAPAEGLSQKLDQILNAILRGQVIMLDGKTLVGSTAVRYDNELGQRRVLTERGAL